MQQDEHIPGEILPRSSLATSSPTFGTSGQRVGGHGQPQFALCCLGLSHSFSGNTPHTSMLGNVLSLPQEPVLHELLQLARRSSTNSSSPSRSHPSTDLLHPCSALTACTNMGLSMGCKLTFSPPATAWLLLPPCHGPPGDGCSVLSPQPFPS